MAEQRCGEKGYVSKRGSCSRTGRKPFGWKCVKRGGAMCLSVGHDGGERVEEEDRGDEGRIGNDCNGSAHTHRQYASVGGVVRYI